MQGFLTLSSSSGKVLAVGDQVNVAKGGEIHSRLSLNFRDGSLDEETVIFKQDKVFRLISDHHVQKGPSFPEPVDMSFDVESGTVKWRETKNGKTETKTDHMDLPADLSNGLTSALVENFPAHADEMKLSYLAAGSKPRLVTLKVRRMGKEKFRIAGTSRIGTHFLIHIELGGVAGVVAPIFGKQPGDLSVSTIDGEVHSFVRMQGAFYQKGPVWTLNLTSPTWQQHQ